MQLSHVCASGTRIVETHKGDTNKESDKADKRDNAQTWKGNEFLVETHLCQRCSSEDLRTVQRKANELVGSVVKLCHLVVIYEQYRQLAPQRRTEVRSIRHAFGVIVASFVI